MSLIEKHTLSNKNGRLLLLVALCLVLLTHGIILYFTLPKTYDAYVHMFFSDHYARFWFEPNEYRWYTGFLTTSYPPLVHQLIALLSKIFPYKISFVIYAIVVYEVLVIGIYRFTKLFFNKRIAGVAAILTVLSTALIETVHVYGQVPTITGMAFLLNAIPFLYLYLIKRKPYYLIMALSFISVVICSHHVTAIFGMVFFVAPVIFMALSDQITDASKSKWQFLLHVLHKTFVSWKQIILFGGLTILLVIVLILPYWLWSKNDPITQVSIPHGSRDNFFLHPSSGLIFYLIPLALIIALILAINFLLVSRRRNIGWSVSFFSCLLLGSGGTTPLPKLLLGEHAFNILTLDRFGFWAAIIAIPFMAKFIYSFLNGSVKRFWVQRIGERYHFSLAGISGFSYLLFIIFIFHLGSFRPLQPKEIEIQPVLNFLNRDDHIRWRFLTLGFGDQMAWLSTHTLAASVDGNYHSARRLPELTSRPIERLENAKFAGDPGLASLRDFLTQAEKYNLKYVFSNDRYYDPLLFYSGWNRVIQLENGIMVWEKNNISTIKPIRPKALSPVLKIMWGTLPISVLALCILLSFYYLKYYKEDEYNDLVIEKSEGFPAYVNYIASLLPLLFFTSFLTYHVVNILLMNEQKTPTKTVENFYNHLDFQEFERAYHFYKPDPAYSIHQYILEKSVQDGGLLPTYSKLHAIKTRALSKNDHKATVEAQSIWNTAVGTRTTLDTIHLEKQKGKWYILPPEFEAAVPVDQMITYDFTLFKKIGKRIISSFPTVKDDRIKKPFVSIRSLEFINQQSEQYIVGEILNADNIPVNYLACALIHLENGETIKCYPRLDAQYNLSPKATSYFKIPLSIHKETKIKKIEVSIDTDVSEKGYITGGIISYSFEDHNTETEIELNMFNNLPVDMNIPGILIAERNEIGQLVNVKTQLYDKSIRSAQHLDFKHTYKKTTATLYDQPIALYINGAQRQIDTPLNSAKGLNIVPHCFISQTIYLH